MSEFAEKTEGEKTVLVTGGAGFIGSHVADVLMSRGDKVIIVDEMNDYYDVRLKQSNLEYLYNKHGDNCTIYRG
jgi:UDP-glucuronate 4-epimerase